VEQSLRRKNCLSQVPNLPKANSNGLKDLALTDVKDLPSGKAIIEKII
jgi:hypothetical protein